LDHFGRILIRYIVEEAKKDAAKSSAIPDSRDFYTSFQYRVVGNSVEVSSSWPWLDLIVEGTDGPYPMKWLTRAQGVKKVPLRAKDGSLVIRSTPLTTDKAWIHPGIARHTFIQRAFDRARGDFARRVIGENLHTILGKLF
jgi:hypothetical protein